MKDTKTVIVVTFEDDLNSEDAFLLSEAIQKFRGVKHTEIVSGDTVRAAMDKWIGKMGLLLSNALMRDAEKDA